eukprot:gene9195-1281_t
MKKESLTEQLTENINYDEFDVISDTRVSDDDVYSSNGEGQTETYFPKNVTKEQRKKMAKEMRSAILNSDLSMIEDLLKNKNYKVNAFKRKLGIKAGIRDEYLSEFNSDCEGGYSTSEYSGDGYEDYPDYCSYYITWEYMMYVSPYVSWTPLMYASALDNAEVFLKLLELGADINARGRRKMTALNISKKMNNSIKFLYFQTKHFQFQKQMRYLLLNCNFKFE